MTYKEILLAAWQASTKAITVAHTEGEEIDADGLARLYNGLRSAKHEASASNVAGLEQLDDYNIRCSLEPKGVRIEFVIKRKALKRAIKSNPTEFM